MRKATASLIYKQKGKRDDLSKYRPITVSSAEYKILAKAMQLALDEVLHHVIDSSQRAFQRGKFIGEATALAQLTAAFCSHEKRPGLMLLHDGE